MVSANIWKNNYIFIQFDAKMTKKSKNQKKIVKSELDEISFNMNKIQFYSFLIRSSNRKVLIFFIPDIDFAAAKDDEETDEDHDAFAIDVINTTRFDKHATG